MKKVFIQYKIKPEKVNEVEILIEKVFTELRSVLPENIGYSAQKLQDGQSFIHIYTAEVHAKNPIVELASFKELQGFIKVNHLEKPVSMEMTDVGLYNSLYKK